MTQIMMHFAVSSKNEYDPYRTMPHDMTWYESGKTVSFRDKSPLQVHLGLLIRQAICQVPASRQNHRVRDGMTPRNWHFP